MCDRPSGTSRARLHQDRGRTPEGLRAELEQGGADFDKEIAKLNRLGGAAARDASRPHRRCADDALVPAPSRVARPPLR